MFLTYSLIIPDSGHILQVLLVFFFLIFKFYFLAMPYSMWDLSSLTRDRTHAP